MKRVLLVLLAVMLSIPCTGLVLAEEITFDKMISGEIFGITIKDSKQPHVTWDLPEEDMNTMLALLRSTNFVDKKIDKTEHKYLVYIGSHNELISLSIYDNGVVIFAEDSSNSKEFYIEKHKEFIDTMSVLLTTQSKGYGNVMPSAVSLVAVSDWATSFYERANEEKFIPEYMKVGYMTDNITREQFCDIIYNLMSRDTEYYDSDNSVIVFDDTKNPNISALVENDIIYGKGNGLFAPNDFLTREEAATILHRTLLHMNGCNCVSSLPSYNDSQMIQEWATEAVSCMYDAKIMIGTETGFFNPGEKLTKEQAVATVVRLFDYITANR